VSCRVINVDEGASRVIPRYDDVVIEIKPNIDFEARRMSIASEESMDF
jgi:hypothetical protein